MTIYASVYARVYFDGYYCDIPVKLVEKRFQDDILVGDTHEDD